MQQTIQKQTHKTKKKNAWKYILSVLIILIYILPIYVLVVMAFKHPTDLGSRLIPPNYFDLSNFTSIIESGKLFRALGNTSYRSRRNTRWYCSSGSFSVVQTAPRICTAQRQRQCCAFCL